MEVISFGIQKPILRPLIGMDKTEIMDLARQIGTYDVSTQQSHACPFLPDRPLTQASVAKLQALIERMSDSEPQTGATQQSEALGEPADA
jgi:thiamine biosynthesis protein ThiI